MSLEWDPGGTQGWSGHDDDYDFYYDDDGSGGDDKFPTLVEVLKNCNFYCPEQNS